MNYDLSKYPLPVEYKWVEHRTEYAISITYKPEHQPEEIQGVRSEAWVTWWGGKYCCHCRTSTRDSREESPIKTHAPTLDEALQYIYNWVMLGMNRSE